MADQYYFSQDNTPSGPFSAAEMRRLAAAGRIRPTDPVWKEGTAQSVLAARVKNLFPAQPPDVATTQPLEDPSAAAPPALRGAPPHGGPEEDPATVLANATPEAAGPLPGTPAGIAVEQAPAPPAAAARRASQPPARQKRVVAIKGAVLTGQDGVNVQFRKKCETCGHEDGCRSTAIIRLGSSRVPFFCPKCRRPRAVEITAVS